MMTHGPRKTTRFGELVPLFLQFFKFGCFTFGGGWSIVAQMQELYVEREGTLSSAELLDLTSIGRSLPGTMIGNIAVFYGYRAAGFWGGVVCVFGMILPPAVVLAVITHFYTAFQENVWVAAAMRGVRAAVAPVILSALLGMTRGKKAHDNGHGKEKSGSAFRYPPCVVVALLTFALYFFWNVSCVWLVLFGLVCGVAICEYYEAQEVQVSAAAQGRASLTPTEAQEVHVPASAERRDSL